jgi:hypothetical protein
MDNAIAPIDVAAKAGDLESVRKAIRMAVGRSGYHSGRPLPEQRDGPPRSGPRMNYAFA